MRLVFTGWIILILLNSAITRADDLPPPDQPPMPPEYTYVDHEGYQYSYKTTVGGGDESWIGTVEVKAPKTHEVVFKQTKLSPGGCSVKEFAKPHALRYGPDPDNWEIVALCGEDEGHFPTLMLFEKGDLVARLDYVITEPNLVWHPEYQSYLAEIVFREGMKIIGMAYLPMIYEWTPISDNTDNGFHPIFNSHSYKQYLQDYKQFKNTKGYGDTWYLLMIATLVATSKTSLICAELNSPPLNRLTKKQVKKYQSIAEDDGYPAFDLSICKRGRKK